MLKKLFAVFLILLAATPIALAAPTKREYYTPTYSGSYSYYGGAYLAQTFTTPSGVLTTHTVTSIKVENSFTGNVNNVYSYCALRATDANGKPTGSNLAVGSLYCANPDWTGTRTYRTYTMNTEVTLNTNTKYAIVMYATGGTASNYPKLSYSNTDYDTTKGEGWSSSNSGSTWSALAKPPYDFLFEVWGNDAVANYTITSSPTTGTGYIKVDGASQTSPYSEVFPVGSVHLIEAISPRVITSDVERRVYTSWSDSGAQTHNITITMGDKTVTSNYHTEYKHIIDSDPIAGDNIIIFNGTDQESPYTTNWIDSNTTFGLNAYLLPEGFAGYCFDYWSDLIARDHDVQPITSANYTAYFADVPPWNATLLVSGNATMTFNGSPFTAPKYFNLTAGSNYTVTATGFGSGSGSGSINLGLLISLAIVFGIIFALLRRDS